MKEMSNTTTVTALMAMNMGFRSVAPMSEMYLGIVRMTFHFVNKQGRNLNVRNMLSRVHRRQMRFAICDPGQ